MEVRETRHPPKWHVLWCPEFDGSEARETLRFLNLKKTEATAAVLRPLDGGDC